MKTSVYIPDDLARAVEKMQPDIGWSERCQIGLRLLLAGATDEQIAQVEEAAMENARQQVRKMFGKEVK